MLRSCAAKRTSVWAPGPEKARCSLSPELTTSPPVYLPDKKSEGEPPIGNMTVNACRCPYINRSLPKRTKQHGPTSQVRNGLALTAAKWPSRDLESDDGVGVGGVVCEMQGLHLSKLPSTGFPSLPLRPPGPLDMNCPQ